MKSARSDTAEKILDTVEEFIQTRGYNAFSYANVAERVGVRPASIHYHFPTKADLGRAVIERYSAQLTALAKMVEEEESDLWRLLLRYLEPFHAFADSGERICLCGALAGEYGALPGDMRALVAAFFVEHETWLARIFAKGLDSGVFTFSVEPAVLGRAFFMALQGGLLVGRTAENGRAQLDDCVTVFLTVLRGED
ncbi:MAG: TetR/AcrR family transcriptional regulator [Alphaproteobacteria bacterium]